MYSTQERDVYVYSRKNNISRRNFIKRIGRYTMLTAFFIGGGILFRRKKIIPKPIETCINQGICRGCSVLEDCTLPLALSMKRATVKKYTAERT